VSVLLMAARLKRSLMAVHDRLTILRKRQKEKPRLPRSDPG
jgi:hypothetical protein